MGAGLTHLKGKVMPKSNFEMEQNIAERILSVIDLALPQGSPAEKTKAAMITLDVLSIIPMSEFPVLGSAIQDLRIIPEESQKNVRSHIRTLITELRIG